MIRNSSLLALFGVIAFSLSAPAGNWTDSAFPVKNHDFGSVAVASNTEHIFEVYNPLSSAMHLQSVRASCGCTTPTILDHYIQPGQKGRIKAKFNTDSFRGKKGATLTVVVDQPFYTEVRLKVSGYIRSDVVFHPGSIEFGQTNQGDTVAKSTKILYAGRSDWKIVDVRSNQPWLMPNLKETVRNGGTVNYELTIDLREDAPTGAFQDEIVVVTNDRNMPNVPLKVTGTIQSALTLSPQAISLGSLKPGEPVQSKMVLVGQTPFSIKSISAEGWDVSYDAGDAAKKMHLLRPTFTFVGDEVGPQKTAIVIKTAGEASVTAKGVLTADVRDQ